MKTVKEEIKYCAGGQGCRESDYNQENENCKHCIEDNNERQNLTAGYGR